MGLPVHVENLHLQDWATHFGSVAVLTDSAFQLQPADAWQPAQLAFNTNILQVTWGHVGPFVVQAVISPGADHGVQVEWQLPATVLSARITIPGT